VVATDDDVVTQAGVVTAEAEVVTTEVEVVTTEAEVVTTEAEVVTTEAEVVTTEVEVGRGWGRAPSLQVTADGEADRGRAGAEPQSGRVVALAKRQDLAGVVAGKARFSCLQRDARLIHLVFPIKRPHHPGHFQVRQARCSSGMAARAAG